MCHLCNEIDLIVSIRSSDSSNDQANLQTRIVSVRVAVRVAITVAKGTSIESVGSTVSKLTAGDVLIRRNFFLDRVWFIFGLFNLWTSYTAGHQNHQ
jgi:hypothetical protein